MTTKILAALAAGALLLGTIFYDTISRPKNMPSRQAQEEVRKDFKPVPNFDFKTMDGQELSLKDIETETILIHFWAGWCSVCFAEFPGLLEHVKKSDGKTVLLAISIDDDFSLSEKFMGRLKNLENVNLDASNVYWIWDKDKNISLRIFNTVRVPETIIVNAQRMMTGKFVGPGPWDSSDTFIHP